MNYDVAILGAGLAGNCLARQLKRRNPNISVTMIDKTNGPKVKVGESSVETATYYLAEDLGLLNYLYRKHLPKHALRFFYDSETKDLPLTKMGELGTYTFPVHPSFQLDRKVLEEDLLEMNQEAGIDIHLNSKVVDIEIRSEEDGPHTVTYEDASGRQSIEARWVVDCTGRSRMLAKKLGLKADYNIGLKHSAAWGWFKTMKDIDQIDDHPWRARVNYNSRMMSTNHFMYKGYWFWTIPIAEGIISIGCVYEREKVNGPKTREQFIDFIKQHRALGELLDEKDLMEFQHYAHLAYTTEQYFSKDRWALSGESGAFPDPFYSPGSDLIGTTNSITTNLIISDLEGCSSDEMEEMVKRYEDFYKERLENFLLLFRDSYKYFGSMPVSQIKYFFEVSDYFTVYVWPYTAGKLNDMSWVLKNAKRGPIAARLASWRRSLYDAIVEHYETNKGGYCAGNEGQWYPITYDTERIFKLVEGEYTDDRAFEFLGKTYGLGFIRVLEMLYDLPIGNRKIFADALPLFTVLEFDCRAPGIVEKVIAMGKMLLFKKLRAEFRHIGIESLEYSDAMNPLAGVTVMVDGGAVPANDPLSKIANDMWLEVASKAWDSYYKDLETVSKERAARQKMSEGWTRPSLMMADSMTNAPMMGEPDSYPMREKHVSMRAKVEKGTRSLAGMGKMTNAPAMEEKHIG